MTTTITTIIETPANQDRPWRSSQRREGESFVRCQKKRGGMTAMLC